jgi:hypothetical protein
MKSSTFWDVTPCSPLKFNRHSGGTCSLHLQGRRINRERNQREAGSKLLVGLFFDTEDAETSGAFQKTTWRYIPEDRTPRLRNVFVLIIKSK